MQTYEYKAVPAPNRSKRVKGVKTTAGRFAALLTDTMNELAREGWEYMRSDSLPVEDKPGLLKSRVETYQTMLVFRRPVIAVAETPMAGYIEDQTEVIAPEPTPEPAAAVEPEPDPEPAVDWPAEPEPRPRAEPSAKASWINPDARRDPPLRAARKPAGEDSPFGKPTDAPDKT